MRFARLALALLSTTTLAGLAACSDPEPPIPQGAGLVGFRDPSAECTIKDHQGKIGELTKTTKTTVVSNGQAGAEVECKVTSSGGAYNVYGRMVSGSTGLVISIPKISPDTKEAMPAEGNVTFLSQETAGTGYSSIGQMPQCKFYFAEGSTQTVASGRIWVTFSCSKVAQSMSTCALGESVALFENCGEE